MRFVEIVLLCGVLSGMAQGAEPYKAMFVFGDSYSDIGEGYLDGNGPTAAAYLAEDLGLRLIASNQDGAPERSLDFAVSGAQTGRGEGKKVEGALLGFGMENQVAEFGKRVKEGKVRFDGERTLFFLAGGLNDGRLETATTIGNLEHEIRELYAMGGRHFAVALLPTAIPGFVSEGKRLNPALETIPAQLKKDLPEADVFLLHWGTYFDEVMENPAQYGIRNTKDACAGRAIFHESEKPCATPDTYFYYHAEHPSTAVHKIVGKKMAQELSGLQKK